MRLTENVEVGAASIEVARSVFTRMAILLNHNYGVAETKEQTKMRWVIDDDDLNLVITLNIWSNTNPAEPDQPFVTRTEFNIWVHTDNVFRFVDGRPERSIREHLFDRYEKLTAMTESFRKIVNRDICGEG